MYKNIKHSCKAKIGIIWKMLNAKTTRQLIYKIKYKQLTTTLHLKYISVTPLYQ